MKRTLIRYKTTPEMADENAELIAGVFAELKATEPDGVRYLSLRLEDNPRKFPNLPPGVAFSARKRQ